MPGWLIVILCAIAAVALFVVGMSLTLIFKGHHIDSEISTNKDMQRLGIKCAVQETREADGTAECIRHGTLPVWGVQWHPERQSYALRRPDAADGAAVFEAFAAQVEQE